MPCRKYIRTVGAVAAWATIALFHPIPRNVRTAVYSWNISLLTEIPLFLWGGRILRTRAPHTWNLIVRKLVALINHLKSPQTQQIYVPLIRMVFFQIANLQSRVRGTICESSHTKNRKEATLTLVAGWYVFSNRSSRIKCNRFTRAECEEGSNEE